MFWAGFAFQQPAAKNLTCNYNSGMKTHRFLILIGLIGLAGMIFTPMGAVRSAVASPYDLVAMVNDVRRNNGLEEIEIHEALMSSAQMQSDYLGSAYGTNFPDWEAGHIGAGGTRAIDRAIASGYPVPSGGNVLENWAGGNNSTALSEIVYSYWSDASHWSQMLHPDAVDIGAGITEGDGYVYYILNIGVKYGSGGGTSGGVASTVPTTAVTPKVAPVTVADAQEDGSVLHTVKIGEALWSIAAAYEVTVDQLIALNDLPSDPIIYEGQTLLVRLAYTPTPSPTVTSTPKPPTRTPVPPQTAQAVVTATQEDADGGGLFDMDRQTLGLALILICGIGLVLVITGTLAKDKGKKK